MTGSDSDIGGSRTGSRTWLGRAGMAAVVVASAVATAVIASLAIDLVVRLF